MSMDMKRILCITVEHDQDMQKGKLEKLDLEVTVDEAYPNADSIKFLMSLDHKTYLRCHFGCPAENIESGISIFESKLEGFDAFQKKFPSSIETYYVPSKREDGTTVHPQLCSTYLTVPYQNLMRDMISFMSYIHGKKKFLEGDISTENNLCFKNSEIKFYDLKFKSFSESSAPKDYQTLSFLLLDIIGHGNLDSKLMPRDVGDLLNIMTNYREEYEDLVNNHLGILSTKERITRIKIFFTQQHTMSAPLAYQYPFAVNAMNRSADNRGNWTRRFVKFKNGGDEKVGPACNCFCVKNVKPYDNGNLSLLRFCRNLAEHMNQHFWKHTSGTFTNKDVELVVMTLFGHELLSFQREASSRSILIHLLGD